MLAIDTETTGLDLLHGCQPFFVTLCGDARGETAVFYEWDVDPLTRKVTPDPADVREIQNKIVVCGKWADSPTYELHTLVLHNAKFDVKALEVVGVKDWPWGMTRDTLIAAHLLNSAQAKDLTSIATNYLRIDIKGREDALEKAVKTARDHCRRYLKDWKISDGTNPEQPSDREGSWRADYWLPRALVKHWWTTTGEFQYAPHRIEDEGEHPWWTVLSDYATADSEMTMACWQVMQGELQRKNLYPIFLERMKLVPIVHGMEVRGVTFLGGAVDEAEKTFDRKAQEAGEVCLGIAESDGYALSLPKGSSNNKSLTSYIYDVLSLPVVKLTEKGNPSLDAETFETWMDTLPHNGKGRAFIGTLMKRRNLAKSLTDVATYKRFRRPTRHPGVYTLHPDINPTGSATLRYSFKNPNTANVKKPDEDGGPDDFSMRHAFGPAPGRVWVACDYENIELRIPGYESGEEAMIALFEKPNDAPFFGSYHLLNASIICPDLFWPLADKKGAFKEKYGNSWYQWIKNAGFALIYGCQEGKFDRTARKQGGYQLLRSKLPKLFRLSDKWVAYANKHGYVETMPDKTVDPDRGYLVACVRGDYGRVSPTVPLNYHVQSTAMWCTSKAMVRCEGQLRGWLENELRDYWIALQVHDELVFDMPLQAEQELSRKVNVLRGLMEKSGEDIGVPLKVSAKLHKEHWGKGTGIALAV